MNRGAPLVVTMLAGALFAGTTLAACGEAEPGLGAGTAAPPPTTTTTTVVTPPTAPTTTIDFNRPISQDRTPLPAEAGLSEIVALVDDLRGPSANVPVQIGRLAPFAPIQGPTVAQITEIAVTLSAPTDDGHPATAMARFRIPGDGDSMLDALDDELRSIGWFQAGATTGQSSAGQPTTVALFRSPGFAADELELRVGFESGPGPIEVEFTYVVVASSDDVDSGDELTDFNRLAAWQDDLPVPNGADLVDVGLVASEETLVVSATYLSVADDMTDAIATTAAAVGASDFELLGATTDDPPATGPLRLVDEAGTIVVLDIAPTADSEQFEIVASTEVALTPVD